MTTNVSEADIELATRLLRAENGGRDPYAPSVLPVARVLKAYREQLLTVIEAATVRPPPISSMYVQPTDGEILNRVRRRIAQLREGNRE